MRPGAMIIALMSLMMLGVCNGFSEGPPSTEKVCDSMVPEHDQEFPAQTTKAPYRLNFSTSCFTPGLSLRVSLAGVDVNKTFKGFLIQARKLNNESFSYGTFNNEGDLELKTLDCFNQSASAITHQNRASKDFSMKTFEWTAPADGSIDVIQFVATVVKEYETYWLEVRVQIARCNNNRDNSLLFENNNTDGTPSAFIAAASTAGATTAAALTTPAPITTVATPATTVATAKGSINDKLSTATVTTTFINNVTSHANDTSYTLSYSASAAAAAASSDTKSTDGPITTAAITTVSATRQTTSDADRRKYATFLVALSVACVASLASFSRLSYQ